MTLRELLEQAHLSALGLLDADDQRDFEAALARAPRSLREQVIAEQARWASGGHLLPDVAPPQALRDRVLDSVHAAIVDDALAGDEASIELPGQRRRVHQGWRMASVGLLMGVAVMGGAFGYVYQNNQAMQREMDNVRVMNEHATAFGPHFQSAIFDATTQRTFFSPVGEQGIGRVVVVANPQWDTARVFFADMPDQPDTSYRIVELDDDGQVLTELGSFEGASQAASATIRAPRVGARLAIVIAPAGQPATGAAVFMRAV